MSLIVFVEFVVMKKYQQLVLTVFAFAGTVLFMYYKHEYNRLHAVLEVLDTFGSSDCHNGVRNTREGTPMKKFIIENNLEGWRQVGNFHLYSAHVISNLFTKVQLLCVGVNFSELSEECTIWSDGENKNIQGKLSIEYLDYEIVSGNAKPAVITCSSEKLINDPFAVSISANIKNEKYEQVISINSIAKTVNKSDIAVCAVIPNILFTNLLEVIEFTEFHRLVGFQRIYLYVKAIGPRMKKFFRQYQQQSSIVINIIPWTPPTTSDISSNVLKTVLTNDCLFRSRATSSYVMMSSLNHILIPRYHDKIQDIINEIEEITSQPRAYLQFNSKLFCAEKSDDSDRSLLPLVALRNTEWLTQDTTTNYSLINNRITSHITSNFTIFHDNKYRDYLVPGDVVILHKYEKCFTKSESLKHDPIAQKYKDKLTLAGFIQSAILKKSV